ncbi:MAG: sulfatase-like hydrolase/transferase [Planctomycetota bacterium]|nr:sulfatase-like hydrolase/transferase [Planctomycetota bacterium]
MAPQILITIPGLPAGRLGHLGNKNSVSPGVDRMAECGTTFLTAYADANHEIPSTVSLMVAEPPSVHGVKEKGDTLPPAWMTLAERFSMAGYLTAAFLGNPDLANRGLEQGFDTFSVGDRRSAQDLLEQAIAFLDGAEPSRTFLWIDLADLLPPYGGADFNPRAFAPDIPPGFGDTAEDYGLFPADYVKRGWSRQEAKWLSSRFDAALASLDSALTTFMEKLEDRNLLELHTVTLAGTCGARLGTGPGPVGSRGVDLSEPSIRVPLLVRLPAQHVRGLRLRRFVQISDIGPTLLDLATSNEWDGAFGQSLMEVIRLQQRVRNHAFSEGLLHRPDGTSRQATALTYTTNQTTYKAVVADDGEVLQFFHLSQDPIERAPLTLQPGQKQDLLNRFSQWRRPNQDG